jgi:AcrR family transcriptional regulator
MAPRSGLREKKNVAAKQAFFGAAMYLFRKQGFEKTSVDEIAERAGFSRATFFNHFGTKQGVLRYYGQHLQTRVERIVGDADPSQNPLELIREILFTMAKEAEAHREDLKVVYMYSLQDPDYQKGPTPARQRVWDILTGLVEQAQHQQLIRKDIPARDQALYIMSLHLSTVMAMVAGYGSVEPMLSSIWKFILGGIRSEHTPLE